MKTLACQDMGIECDFVAKDETAEGAIQKGMEHVRKVHPDKIKEMMSMMSEEEMIEQAKAKVKEEK